jgi:hypothetical protein
VPLAYAKTPEFAESQPSRLPTRKMSFNDVRRPLPTRKGGRSNDAVREGEAVVMLLPGQLERISVPVAIGERQQVLRIRRLGDRLEVARVFGPSV